MRLLSSQRTGQQEMFEYHSYTQRTTVNLPTNYILIIPEDLSYQLGMEGRVYMEYMHPNSSVNMQTVNFPRLICHPMKHTCFRQVTVYLRDSAGQPIPFEYREVSVVLSLRPDLAVRGSFV